MSLFTQDKWPGQKGNIFCIRDTKDESIKVLDIIETVNIAALRRYGKKLTIILERSVKKRCDFLFLEKKYKSKEGTYEQIFFRTQQGVTAHKSRGNLNLYNSGEKLNIVIDSNERYPWLFSNHVVTRRNLPVGDYGLVHDNKLYGIIERKTFDNMLADTSRIQVLHHQFAELSLYPYSAVVIEAQYGDFLSKQRIKNRSANAISRVLSELSVIHNKLHVVYAGTRKEANQWSVRFFEGVRSAINNTGDEIISTVIQKIKNSDREINPLWLQVDNAVLEMSLEFTTSDICDRLPRLSRDLIRRYLIDMENSGDLAKTGTGKGTIWRKNLDK